MPFDGGKFKAPYAIPNTTTVVQCHWTSSGDHLVVIDAGNSISHLRVETSPQLSTKPPVKALVGIEGSLRLGCTWDARHAEVPQSLDAMVAVYAPPLRRYRSSQAGTLDLDQVETRILQHARGQQEDGEEMEHGAGSGSADDGQVLRPKFKAATEDCRVWKSMADCPPALPPSPSPSPATAG